MIKFHAMLDVNWWLVGTTCVVYGCFFGHSFGRLRALCAHILASMELLYMLDAYEDGDITTCTDTPQLQILSYVRRWGILMCSTYRP